MQMMGTLSINQLNLKNEKRKTIIATKGLQP